MKKEKVNVKSKGAVVGQTEVPIYASLDEVKKLTGFTDEKLLAIINKKFSDDICNQFRASVVRPASPAARLGRITKANPKAAAEIEALIKKYSG